MKHIRSIYSVGTVLLLAALSGCASQKACSGTGCTPDEKTTAAVTAAISAHPDLGPPSQIEVSTINHVVYLTGIVDTGYQRSTAERLAARTDGVAKVVDTIGLAK
jgi:osmotically-inducible protein OsmY